MKSKSDKSGAQGLVVACLTWDQGVEDSRYIGGTVRGASLIPASWRFIMELFLRSFISLLLIQEGSLSVTCESICAQSTG